MSDNFMRCYLNTGNTPKTIYPVTSAPPNPKPNQRTSNSNCQRNNRRNRHNNLDYNPEEDDDFLKKKHLYYVSKEYAQFCLESGEGYLPRDVAQDIVDQG
ncbi:hypothetical protein F8M41_019295 [Gigaspora margarita]|uniref:Uncharacterized protein n=1 Tax=Gigaspora margarita TaxID=4874 RepID=A0A8H4EKM3_GIGMA|nr:hypothetical protein F8M41_019295 [Gigaspora margarita]